MKQLHVNMIGKGIQLYKAACIHGQISRLNQSELFLLPQISVSDLTFVQKWCPFRTANNNPVPTSLRIILVLVKYTLADRGRDTTHALSMLRNTVIQEEYWKDQ